MLSAYETNLCHRLDLRHQPYQPNPPHQPSIVSALRRCRQPVPARVVVAGDRPVAVTTDRRGFAGGRVLACAGTVAVVRRMVGTRRSDDRRQSVAGRAGQADGETPTQPAVTSRTATATRATWTDQPHQPHPPDLPYPSYQSSWNRDEWDVSLSDGAVYRIFQDRDTDRWFIDAIVD